MGLVGIKIVFQSIIYLRSFSSQEKLYLSDGRRYINIFYYLTPCHCHSVIPFYLLWFCLSVSLSLTSLFLNVNLNKREDQMYQKRSMCIVGGVGVVLFFYCFLGVGRRRRLVMFVNCSTSMLFLLNIRTFGCIYIKHATHTKKNWIKLVKLRE